MINYSVCIACGRAAACARRACPVRGMRLDAPVTPLSGAMMGHLPPDALVVLPVGGTDPWVGVDDRAWDEAHQEPLELRAF